MEQNFKDQEVLLVKEQGVDEVRAVSRIGEDGILKTLPADRLNESEFLKIDRHGNMLENFFSNFMRQAKDPSHFNFFKVQLEEVETSAQSISNVYKGSVDIDDEVIVDIPQATHSRFRRSPFTFLSECSDMYLQI